MKQLIQHKKIAIIGGGPAGLTLACLLQQKGASVTVYERDVHKDVRISGGPLDIHRNSGQLALEAAGVMDAFYQYARPTGESMYTMTGELVMEQMPTDAEKYERPELDRNDLRTMLLNKLIPGTVVYNRHLLSVIPVNNHYLLHFEQGITEKADIVIGADGARSKVRPQVTTAVREYSGSVMIEGEISNPSVSCPVMYQKCSNKNVMIMGANKVLFVHPKHNGNLIFHASFRREENWAANSGIDWKDAAAVRFFLTQLFTGWNNDCHEIFAACPQFLLLPVYRLPLTETWAARGNITLIGDAAHLMPPYAGEGANMGLLDAWHLGSNLTGEAFNSISDAILAYEKMMFSYAREAQEITSLSEEVLHTQGPKEVLQLRAGGEIQA